MKQGDSRKSTNRKLKMSILRMSAKWLMRSLSIRPVVPVASLVRSRDSYTEEYLQGSGCSESTLISWTILMKPS